MALEWLKRLFGSRGSLDRAAHSVRRITAGNPLVIQSPRIGFLNLLGPSGAAIRDTDKAAFGPLFAHAEESETDPPVCDVLLIYAHLEADGHVRGASRGLRELIQQSHAPIVIIASENDGKSYIAAAKPTGYGQANLVMTISRKEVAFPQFFGELFRRMFGGTSMPLAWVQLAPQHPGAQPGNCPDTIFAAEVSHIVFK